MAEFAIGTRMVGDGHPPLVIAEIGVNHLGDMRIARDMIKAAADAGAECVKGQCHIPHEEQTDAVPERVRETIRRCALDADQERELCDYARSLGLIYISTPFSVAAADRLHALDLPAYKIGSGELTNTPLLERVASFGKPVIVSTGMATTGDLIDICNLLYDRNVDKAFLHCTSLYPTPPSAVRLGSMRQLRGALFQDVVGLSDHSRGIACAMGAVALGAHIIEKHFTLSHDLETPDAEVSIDPRELADLVAGAKAVWQASSDVVHDWDAIMESDWERPVSSAELEVAAWARHSVTLRRAVKAGEVLTAEHLTCKRPAGGLPPSKLRECIGRVAYRDMPADWQVREEDIA